MLIKENENKKQHIRKTQRNADWLRDFKGFESYSNDKAIEVVTSLETLAHIICEHITKTR